MTSLLYRILIDMFCIVMFGDQTFATASAAKLQCYFNGSLASDIVANFLSQTEEWKTYQLRFCLTKMLVYVINNRLASYLDEKFK